MSEQDLNKELEELLDAELTEEEVSNVEAEIADISEAPKKAKKEEDEPEEDEEEDEVEESKAKKEEDEPEEDDEEDEVEEKAKKSAKKESVEADLSEGRLTKAKMLEDLGKMVEGLGKMKAGELKGVHEKLKKIVAGDDDEEEEDEVEESVQRELTALEAQKKEIEEKIKKISVKEDVEALVQGEDDLSDEFKEKAATIFEAAVKTKVRDEIETIEDEYAEKLAESIVKHDEETSEKVDAYLNYVVQEWMKDNEVAIEHKLKTDISENFITALKGLFEEHNITVPDEKYDVLDAAAKQADEMEAKLNEQIEKNVELSQKVSELEKNEILVDVASDLADTEVEKFVGLAENVEYEDSDDFKKKLQTIKESYFPRHAAKDDEAEAAPVYEENGDLSNQMAAYMSAIGKAEKRAQK